MYPGAFIFYQYIKLEIYTRKWKFVVNSANNPKVYISDQCYHTGQFCWGNSVGADRGDVDQAMSSLNSYVWTYSADQSDQSLYV